MAAKQLLLFAICLTVVGAQRFKVLYEWNYLNFTWASEDAFRNVVSLGIYIPENNIISSVKYHDNWFYITLPRMKQGVPATLARIPAMAYENDTEPLLEAYPSWGMNLEGECSSLQNVQNIEIDTKGKMWIIDGGRTATMTKFASTKCKPRLLIFDIKNNVTITNYYFPEEIADQRSYLYDILIDEVDGDYAYITDNSIIDPGIIVYSVKQGKSWKIRDNATMRAAPDAIEFRVSGTAISNPINLAGIALGTRAFTSQTQTFVAQDRTVYFCPLSSTHLYSIQSSELKNEHNTNVGDKIKDLGRKSSQTDGMIMDENGILYFGLLSDNSIATWDSKTPFTSGQKVIARDPIHIQWPDALAFDDEGHLLVVTNRLQKFINGQMNLSEPNFRILEADIGVKNYLYGVPHSKNEENLEAMPRNVYHESSTEYNHGLYENHLSTSSSIRDITQVENSQRGNSAINLKDNFIVLLTVLSILFLQ